MSTILIILALVILTDWIFFEGFITQLLWYLVIFFFTVTVFYFIGKSVYLVILQSWA